MHAYVSAVRGETEARHYWTSNALLSEGAVRRDDQVSAPAQCSGLSKACLRGHGAACYHTIAKRTVLWGYPVLLVLACPRSGACVNFYQ